MDSLLKSFSYVEISIENLSLASFYLTNHISHFTSQQRNEEGAQTVRSSLQVNHARPNEYALDMRDRNYDMQFFKMYQYRLNVLRKRVQSCCEAKWDHDFKIQGKNVVKKSKVLDIRAGEPCWCIGTVYCEMKYKPNILQEVVEDTYGAPDLTKSYTDPNGTDEIMLDDESGRVILVGDLVKNTPFVSGTVIGILGMEADAGTFQVLDICYPKALPQKSLPSLKNTKVALISGINATPNSPVGSLRLQLLQDTLTGELDSNSDLAQCSRCMIVGNSLSPGENRNDLPGSLKELTPFLSNILKSIPVDILPGENDPSDKSLPQQPLHKALFDDALNPFFEKENSDIFNTVTNPYWFDIAGLQLLATSGQQIDDIVKYIIPYYEETRTLKGDTIEHRLDLAEATLKWQNIAPTAPDTLWCYPYSESDPFILNEWPHVYIIGNQPQFGYRRVELEGGIEVTIISVPEFSSTGQFLTLDLETLTPQVHSIVV